MRSTLPLKVYYAGDVFVNVSAEICYMHPPPFFFFTFHLIARLYRALQVLISLAGCIKWHLVKLWLSFVLFGDDLLISTLY